METHRTKLYSRVYSSPISFFWPSIGWVMGQKEIQDSNLGLKRSKVIELSALLGEELPYIVAWRAKGVVR